MSDTEAPETMSAEAFKAWRDARKLSRKRLADELGVAPRTVFNYEAGTTPVKSIVIKRLRELERRLKPVEAP